MRYIVKNIQDSDKENAQQLELILNNKSATYDDISEVIKKRIDNFELKDSKIEEQLSEEAINEMLHDLTEFGMAPGYITSINNGKGICIKSINPIGMRAAMPAVIGGLNHSVVIEDDIELTKMKEPSFPANRNPYYPRKYASKDTMEIIDAILFQEEKQPKENHPHGWYRKFEKKRF